MSGSLEAYARFVPDAFKIRAAVPFKPENVTLGQYTFLPWVRAGLAAALENPAGGALRATVTVSMAVQDDKGGSEPVSQTLTLRGPGDVLGIDPTQIIRRVPAPATVNAEESFLAHVEFDRPELPWLFTPFTPVDDKLQPWLVLVVCDARVANLLPGAPGLPQVLSTPLGELPSLIDSWAWAHAQVVGPATPDGGGASVADRLTDEHGPANLSRIICPRRLANNTSYLACLVPTFDCGVKAALGLPGGTLGPAWQRAADGSDAPTRVILPVYDSWQFTTAGEGDFESLAKKLEGVAAPWNIGRRIIDASQPQGNLPALPDGAPGEVQVLRCALVSPVPKPPDAPSEAATWDVVTRDALRREVDRAAAAAEDVLPRVGPRLYARFQRGQATIGPVFGAPPTSPDAADADWFPQLNTAPMHRVVAGLGTRVVQKDQEPLMQAAWAQVGDVERANRTLARIQFGRYVGEALLRAHLTKLPLGDLAQVLRGVQGKLRQPGAPSLTVHGAVEVSRVAPGAMTAAFRRTTRLRGPIARRAGQEGRAALRQILATPAAFQDFRRIYVEPEGVITLSPAAIAAIPPALIARKLAVPEAAAPGALADRLATRTGSLSIADVVSTPVASWRVPSGTIDLGAVAATRLAERVTAAMPARVEDDPARSEALGSLLVGLANTDVPRVSSVARETVERMGGRLPFSPVRIDPGLPTNIGLPRAVVLHRSARPGAVLEGVGAGGVRDAIIGRNVARPVPAQPAAPQTARLRFETPVSRAITEEVARSRAVPALEAAAALSQLVLGIGTLDLARTPDRPLLLVEKSSLLRAVDPAKTLTSYAKSRLARMPDWLPGDWFADGRIAPIMAAPRFDRPMYEALDAYGREWLVPGLGRIPKTDFVTLLNTNPAFTEGFLVGLSDEMGRELLWRGYPTDQRGTYFRRFWDAHEDELAQDIHRFARTPLGAHLKDGGGGHLVLVVRGELVRRYPDALVLAMRAGGFDNGKPIFVDPGADPTAMAEILFHAQLPPDIILIGFRLTVAQVQSEPWWFVIAEHPTEPRFGLDLFVEGNPRAAGTIERNKLDWNDLTSPDGRLDLGLFLSPRGRTVAINDEVSTPKVVTWPGTAAVVARTLLQNPIRAAFNGQKLIAPAVS